MGRRWDVVGGGAVARDLLLVVEGALGDAKSRVTQREERFGGNIAAGLVAAARDGARTAYLGHLPATGPELDVVEWLRSEGVDTDASRRTDDSWPIRATILIDRNGDRFIVYDDRTLIGLPEDLDLDLVAQAGVLLLDRFGMTANLRAAAHARTTGTAVLLDIESADDPRTAELFGYADHLVLPHDFALEWTGTTGPADAVDALWTADTAGVVVTVGAAGCWYRTPGSPVTHQPATPVEVVDSTGCGDVFHGVYAARLARGLPVPQCVAAASAAAAECATHVGGAGPRPPS